MELTYDELLGHVNDFWADRQRTQGETKDLLQQLSAEIEIMIEALDDD